MCTVSFIPLGNNIIITSNRDEQHGRAPALAPELQQFSTGQILFPKDTHAGGTWFAVHEQGNVLVFLNGATEKHDSNPPYRRSRGLILLDILNDRNPLGKFLSIDLNQIEPFTAILWVNGKLYECRWDGLNRMCSNMDSTIPQIWSSATLFDERARMKRQKWFDHWLRENPSPTQDDILDFHHFNGYGDHHDGILMNRNGLVYTVSVSSVLLSEGEAIFKYLDVQQHRAFLKEMLLTKAISAKS